MQIHALEKQIIGEVWTSEVYANVEALCDFGSRFTGTESATQARDFIAAKFREYGLQKVRLPTFDFLAWERDGAVLRTTASPAKDFPSTISLVYSPSTPPAGLRAEVVWVGLGTKAEFEAKAEQLKGKFAVGTSPGKIRQRGSGRRGGFHLCQPFAGHVGSHW